MISDLYLLKHLNKPQAQNSFLSSFLAKIHFSTKHSHLAVKQLRSNHYMQKRSNFKHITFCQRLITTSLKALNYYQIQVKSVSQNESKKKVEKNLQKHHLGNQTLT